MRKPIVAGNWKMHGSNSLVFELLNELKRNILVSEAEASEIVVCPPFVFLQQAEELLLGSLIKLGAQNLYPAQEGAYTGEVSPSMLLELGCEYVIVGHSERRHLFSESSDLVAMKFECAIQKGLKPILCLGETREQREEGNAFQAITEQLKPVLRLENIKELMNHCVIAYEPVWAIGTGLTASPEQAQEVHCFIRQEIQKLDKSLAEKVRILYGGSVKSNNAANLFSMPDIDGGLIGGASLNAQEFSEIAKLCHYC